MKTDKVTKDFLKVRSRNEQFKSVKKNTGICYKNKPFNVKNWLAKYFDVEIDEG